MFTKDSLIKTWIPTFAIFLPANFVAAHYFGEWAWLLIVYGFLAFGALMLWDSYYDLWKVRRHFASVVKDISQEDLDEAVKNFSEHDQEAGEILREELYRISRKGPLGKQGEHGVK